MLLGDAAVATGEEGMMMRRKRMVGRKGSQAVNAGSTPLSARPAAARALPRPQSHHKGQKGLPSFRSAVVSDLKLKCSQHATASTSVSSFVICGWNYMAHLN